MLISTKKIVPLLTIAILLLVVISGEIIVYTGDGHHTSATAERNGVTAEYSFDTDLNIAYQVISLDNSSNKTTGYVAFYDMDYQDVFYRPDVLSSIQWLQKCMKKESLELEIVDLEKLTKMVTSDDHSSAIIFATGILPYTIYQGNEDDPLLRWISEGGMIYWLGNPLGAEYFDEDHIKNPVPNSDVLFYGAKDVTREHIKSEGSVFNNDMIENSFSDLTRQYYNECTFGLDISKLKTEFLTLDYNLEGYYSVTFMKFGEGSMAVFGGGLNTYSIGADVAMTVAHTLACRTTYDTEIIDYVFEDNAKGASGTIGINEEPTDIYMFLGTGDLIYGNNITL